VPYTAAQLTSFYTAVNFGQAPDPATALNFNVIAASNAAGALADQQALAAALQTPQARATTDIAEAVYQFFTGATPSQTGMNYLLNTAGSGLNTSSNNGAGATASAAVPGPGGFNLENRYYNLAISQALGGPQAAAFASTYGGLSLQQTVAKAYEQIVGSAVVGTAQANAAIAAIQGSIPYFQQVAAQRAVGLNQDISTKAIIVGYVLEEAIKADVGAYAQAIDQLNAAVANGTAVYNTNILTTYAPGAPAYGSGVGGGVLPSNLAGSIVAQQRLNLPTGAIVIANGGSSGTTLQLRDASGPNDVLTLVFDNQNIAARPGFSGVSLSQLQFGGTAVPGAVETLKIVSAGTLTSPNVGAENGVTFNPTTAPNTVQISGSQPLFLFTSNAIHPMAIDGSAATAGLTLRGDPTTTAGVAITLIGGSANDTLIAGLSTSAVSQTITGGGGGDLIQLGGAGTVDTKAGTISGFSATHGPIDTIVYKAVSDSILGAGSTGDPGASRTQFPNTGLTDVVVGFVSGQDKIEVKAVGMTQTSMQVIADKGNLADQNAFNALVAAGTVFKDAGGVTRAVAEVHSAGNIYLFFDANHNGVFDANLDLTVQFYQIPTVVAGDLLGS
jgi:hypothetical protein